MLKEVHAGVSQLVEENGPNPFQSRFESERPYLKTKDKHWLAGLLEGEGSFMFGPPTSPNIPTVRVQMTDRDVVARVAKLFGDRAVTRVSPQKSHHRESFIAQVQGYTAVRYMVLLRPLMGDRRRERIDAILSSYAPTRGPGAPAGHGTVLSYSRGCKCAECRAANAAKKRRERAARKAASC